MKKHLFPIKKCTACALLTAVFITGLTGCGFGSNVAAPYNYSTGDYASVDPSPYINTSSHGETTVYDDMEISFYDLTSSYASAFFRNTGDETIFLDKDFTLQREIDGKYTDVGFCNHDVILNDYPASQLPRISAVEYDIETDQYTPFEIDPDASTIELQPGQILKLQFLIILYDIESRHEYEGKYKIIYGEYEFEFELKIDYAC